MGKKTSLSILGFNLFVLFICMLIVKQEHTSFKITIPSHVYKDMKNKIEYKDKLLIRQSRQLNHFNKACDCPKF
jgi:hypothetical protein